MPPDFNKYTLEELESSLAGIDREEYPENYLLLLKALERRRREGPALSEVERILTPEGFKSSLLEDGSILVEYRENHRVDYATLFL